MTKDQFALWLVGYLTVHKADYAEMDPDDAQLIGADVLEAAWSVVSMPLANAVPNGPQPQQGIICDDYQRASGQAPQPGDLGYEDTSKGDGA